MLILYLNEGGDCITFENYSLPSLGVAISNGRSEA